MSCDDGPDYRAGEKAAAQWMKRAPRAARLEVITQLARSHVLDQDMADARRRAETILWVASEGHAGHWHALSEPREIIEQARVR